MLKDMYICLIFFLLSFSCAYGELGRNLINYVIEFFKMVFLSYPMDIQNPMGMDMDMDMNFYTHGYSHE